ncbi:MAG: 50S ribosomal protein L4 [Acidobacteria bacterium]|nr:50S ribosomal protein L4 [Acidobacteriota bacterium]
MKIVVRSLANKKIRKVDVPDEVFGYPYKEHLIHTAVRANRAADRSGTAKTKERGEVKASNRKPWRQKGTGRARAGRSSSPIWRGGGTVFGPRPRSYEFRMSTREKRNALKSALSEKLRTEGFIVLDSLDLETHRTADLVNHLKAFGVEGKVLLVDDYYNTNLGLAARNNPLLKAVDALHLTVYDVVDRGTVLVSQKALDRLVEVLSR